MSSNKGDLTSDRIDYDLDLDNRYDMFSKQRIKADSFFKKFRIALREAYLYHEDESYTLRDLKYNKVYLNYFNNIFDHIMKIFKSDDNNIDQFKVKSIIDYVAKRFNIINSLNIDLKKFASRYKNPVESKIKLDSIEKQDVNSFTIISIDRLLQLVEVSKEKMEEFKDIFPDNSSSSISTPNLNPFKDTIAPPGTSPKANMPTIPPPGALPKTNIPPQVALPKFPDQSSEDSESKTIDISTVRPGSK